MHPVGSSRSHARNGTHATTSACFSFPLSEKIEVHWMVAFGHEPTFSGAAFGDGSGLNPRHHLTRRCGWVVVGSVSIQPREAVISERNGGAQVMMYGLLSGLAQEVPLAELFAFIMAVTHCLPDENGVFTWVIDSFNKGWCSLYRGSFWVCAMSPAGQGQGAFVRNPL